MQLSGDGNWDNMRRQEIDSEQPRRFPSTGAPPADGPAVVVVGSPVVGGPASPAQAAGGGAASAEESSEGGPLKPGALGTKRGFKSGRSLGFLVGRI